ncbi:MAG: type II secretion system protein N [Burkholderiaceae bacterium]
MPSNPQSAWPLRLTTLVAWALAAASAVYWGMKWFSPPPRPVAAAVSAVTGIQADAQAVSRLLGAVQAAAAPVAASVASRFSLLGVVAGASQGGAALIAVDGKPAKPFRVGSRIDDTLMLQSVSARSAVLAPSAEAPAAVTLEMPLKTSAVAGSNIPPPARAQPQQVIPAPSPATPPSAARSAASRLLQQGRSRPPGEAPVPPP